MYSSSKLFEHYRVKICIAADPYKASASHKTVNLDIQSRTKILENKYFLSKHTWEKVQTETLLNTSICTLMLSTTYSIKPCLFIKTMHNPEI